MEFFKRTTEIQFMKARKGAFIFSSFLFLLSIFSLSINGLKFGLDFTGGTQLEIFYSQGGDLNNIRQQLKQAGFSHAQVKIYGSTSHILITLPVQERAVQQTLKDTLSNVLAGGKIVQISYIGPQVGKELALKGILAVIVALLATAIYIAFRFEYRFAIGAMIALVHDPILILGLFSLFHVEFDLISLAAVLTVIGYSLNEAIVIFDRVRENFRKMRKGTPIEIVNLSINQTLSRTIMTAGLMLSAVLTLLIFGGPVLFSFSLAFFIGILAGSYSAMYIAGSLAITLGLERADFIKIDKKIVSDTP